MEKIRIDTGKLRKTAGNISQALRQAEQNTTLIENTQAEMGRMWEGEAKSALEAAFLRDISMLREACASLHQIPSYEEYASDTYETCEASVTESLAGASV